MSRLRRFAWVWSVFGPWHRYTWRTLFPRFRGWDVGCGYCALEAEALRSGRCNRAAMFRYKGKCGTVQRFDVQAPQFGPVYCEQCHRSDTAEVSATGRILVMWTDQDNGETVCTKCVLARHRAMLPVPNPGAKPNTKIRVHASCGQHKVVVS